MDGEDPTPRQAGHGRGLGPLARLLIALILCGILAILCWVVVPMLGAYIPPIVPLLAFAAIALGTLLSLWEARELSRPSDHEFVEGDGDFE